MIPTQELIEYPVFGNAACLVKPGDAKYAGGFLPADVLPAEWHNWFLNKTTSSITCLNAGVGSMEAELNCVVTSAGLTPAAETPGQVAQAISCCVTNATSRTIQITDNAGTNCGNAVCFTSSTALQIKLPATICATLQGNAATATIATCACNDASGCSLGTAARYSCGTFAAAYSNCTSCVAYARIADYARIEHSNELNALYSQTDETQCAMWFNFRNARTGCYTGNTKILHYYFGDRNACTTNVTLHASWFTGNAATACTADVAWRVMDSCNSNTCIYISYAGAGLNKDNLSNFVAFSNGKWQNGKLVLKDVSIDCTAEILAGTGCFKSSCCAKKLWLDSACVYTDFTWSGQAGQPSWVWGGNSAAGMYVYNPSNFCVCYATSAGSATGATRTSYLRTYGATGVGSDTQFNWVGCSGQPTWVWGATAQGNTYVYNPANFSVCYATSSGATDKAAQLRWAGLTWGTTIGGAASCPTACIDMFLFPRTKGTVCFYKKGQQLPYNCTCLLNCYYYSQTY